MSAQAKRRLNELGVPSCNMRDIPRDDPRLVQVVSDLGADADGECAELAIVKIPDDVNWLIEERDGQECVAEIHRVWTGHRTEGT